MNRINEKLAAAKKKQRRLYITLAGIMIVSLLILMTGFIISRGTKIKLTPEEARLTGTVQVSQGIGFAAGTTVYSLLHPPQITVFSPGFKSSVQSIEKNQLGKSITVELFELPGRLTVSTNITNPVIANETAWYIDDKQKAHGKTLNIELEPGSYTLAVDNRFHTLLKQNLEIKRASNTELSIELEPVQGNLEITSYPEGMEVLINKSPAGTTPLIMETLAGSYEINIYSDSYIEVLDTIVIDRHHPVVTRNYKMRLKQAEITADLTPQGGKFLVNGVLIRSLPINVDATVNHTFIYMKQGYYAETKTIRLQADETKHLVFQLKRETGKVNITSTPSADVWINNKNLGTTPLNLSLPAISHKITIKKEGYRTVSKNILPSGKTPKKIAAILIPEKQARLQEAPASYTNTAGIELKLFKPNDTYLMGAPRSERGQRANEFQRSIMLNKPFYAGLYEITQQQFSLFKKNGGTGNLPVTNINWQDAASFCNWLSKKEKFKPFYVEHNNQIIGYESNADGYRLLSEAEWEWLARKAGKSRQTKFTWGNDNTLPPSTVNVADERAKGQVKFYIPQYTDGYEKAAPIGSFQREKSGLYDIGGNVSEWVHDVYSLSPPETDIIYVNPMGDVSGVTHVIKGANFHSGTLTTLRPSFREGLVKGNNETGFRIGRYLYDKNQ